MSEDKSRGGRELPAVDGLTREIEILREARELLTAVYIEHGGEGAISETTWNKVCDFFGFDDSE